MAQIVDADDAAMTADHEHAWQTRSCHRTSDGIVAYQRCRCGRWRLRLGVGVGGGGGRKP
jgi:hypothetical protein